MRHLAFLVTLPLAACSNAANPTPDSGNSEFHDAPTHASADGAAGSGSGSGAGDAAPASLRLLVINEVAASESPDWFEVVNATPDPIDLADFIFVDEKDNFAKAVAFAPKQLGPGELFAQDVDGTTVPFKLGSDEELWVYRASDHALSDGVDWAEGDSPAHGSFARNPDVFGPFTTTTKPTKGAANEF